MSIAAAAAALGARVDELDTVRRRRGGTVVEHRDGNRLFVADDGAVFWWRRAPRPLQNGPLPILTRKPLFSERGRRPAAAPRPGNPPAVAPLLAAAGTFDRTVTA